MIKDAMEKEERKQRRNVVEGFEGTGEMRKGRKKKWRARG